MKPVSHRQHGTFQVQPSIAELLRTCVHPPTLTLQIEHVVRTVVPHKNNDESRKGPGCVFKLFLTDGHLLVQALLHRKLSSLPGLEDLRKGDIVEIHDYVVKKARKKNEQGHVVYLGIENCYVIKEERAVQDATATAPSNLERPTSGKRNLATMLDSPENEDETAGGFVKEDSELSLTEDLTVVTSGQARAEISTSNIAFAATRFADDGSAQDSFPPGKENEENGHISNYAPDDYRTPVKRKVNQHLVLDSDDDDDQAFETVGIDMGTAKKRRLILRELDQNVRSSPPSQPAREPRTNLLKSTPITKHNISSPRQVRFDSSEIVSGQCEIVAKADGQHPSIIDVASGNEYQYEESRSQPNTGDKHSVDRSDNNILTAIPNQLTEAAATATPTSTQPQSLTQGPFHILSSLYSPNLPSKSYMFTALVIPTHVGTHLISRPNSLFPPKRHIKVIDLSLAKRLNATAKATVLNKGLTVAVYRNAHTFKPLVGRAALIRGVVMQRLRSGNTDGPAETRTGEVILNVYPAKSRIQRQSQGWLQSQIGESKKELYSESDGHGAAGQPHPYVEAGTDPQKTRSEVPVTQDRNELPFPGPNSEILNDVVETDWFVDDHDLLRKQGYDIDLLQSWWDQIVGREGSAATSTSARG